MIATESAHETDSPSNAKLYPRPKPRPMPKFEVTEDIVISGIAGRFPESDNIDEFAENLLKNIDMVTLDDRRWPTDLNDGKGARCGKLKSLDKFDAAFFSTLTFLADAMDIEARMMLETSYEAICDAGVNPQTIRGTKTGVYVGINTVGCAEGIPEPDYQDCRKKEAWTWVYGTGKALYANRISFLMDLRGPSNVIDTACSSSLVAVVYALNDLRLGICNQAIVSTANLAQAPFSSSVYIANNIMAPDGKCKVWDRKANGFVRSETVGSLFLQRKSESKRIYATVLHAKTSTDGFNSIGLFSPFWLSQRDLMIETFQEAGVNPNDVKFFESHGTGTYVGDPQEAKAIADAYRHEPPMEPLLIGAVKSNIGHSEGSSGLCSVAKSIIVFETEMIPANLHFEEPNPEIESIINGTLVPVVKNTPFNNKLICVNSVGIGGVNAHALLKKNEKELSPEMLKIMDTIPRLVNVCGRTEAAVKHIFDFIENNPNKANAEFLALLADVMKTIAVKGLASFPYRGYMIIKLNFEENSVGYDYTRTITTATKTQSVWLVFTGMGSQWTAMAKDLMPIKSFANSLERSANVLKPYDIDLMHLLLSDDENALKKSTTNAFVAITSMQLALYDVICLLNLEVKGIIGHSFGEIACAYADGCLTLEQAVLTSYWRGNVVENSKLPKGMLAAVGLSWEDIKNRCPDGIVAACHNGSDSVTISGLYDNMVKFVEQLKSENIFARSVPGGDFPYHSPFMNIVAPQLLDALNRVIPHPKERSVKWVSTSVAQEEWNKDKSKFASGEYFTNNLISPVLFNEGMQEIAKNSLVIEVAPHSLFESIFKRCFPSFTYTALMKRTESDNLNFLLLSIGTLYTHSLNPDIENLYPPIEWPVSRGTQSIGSLIKWDHERPTEVKKYPEYHNHSTASDFSMKFSLLEPELSFLKDHAVEGKVLFPATGYLFMVWRRMAALKGQPWDKTPVIFENVRIFRPTLLSEKNQVKFTIRILEGTGEFTISDGSSIAATGRVFSPVDERILEMQDTLEDSVSSDDKHDEHNSEMLTSKDIYKELRIRGYDYGPKFQGLIEASGDGLRGKAKWTGHVISFMDSLTHLALMTLPIRALYVPVGFQSIRIDPIVLFKEIESIKEEKPEDDTSAKDTLERKQFLYFNQSEADKKILESHNPSEETISEIKRVISYDIKKVQQLMSTVGSQIFGINTIDDNSAGQEEETTLSILPVKFDINMRSIITKGIEITGFIPVHLPRRPANQGLTIEKYEFIPNYEELAIEITEKYAAIEYIEVCCSFVERLSKLTSKMNKPILNGYKCADEATVKKYFDSTNQSYKMLSLLKSIINFKVDENSNVLTEEKEAIDLHSAIKAEANKIENNFNYDLVKTMFTIERFCLPFLDIVVDNSYDNKNIKILELNPTNTILAANIVSGLKNSSVGMINVDYTVATPTPSTVPDDVKTMGIKVMEWDTKDRQYLKNMSSLDLIIYRPTIDLTNSWNIADTVESISQAMRENAFLLLVTRNVLTPPEIAINQLYNIDANKEILLSKELDKIIDAANKINLKLVGKKSDSLTSTMVLLRKLKVANTIPEIINIPTEKYDEWVGVLKEKIENNRNPETDRKNIWLVANDTSINGIIGLVNCLRLEPGGTYIRCIFDYDNKLPKPVDFTKSPYNEICELDLAVNIYKNGKWGSYRHIKMAEQLETVMSEHAYLSVVTRGDMSSLRWFDAPHKFFPTLSPNDKKEHEVLCNVYYSALNFRDVMIVSGKIQPGPESALFDCIIGLEFAGRRSDNGKRVMGMVPFKGIATTLLTHNDTLWEVPDEWTLEEAATVPLVYTTAYYALIIRGNLQEGESVLIHSGAGGVGQAAIYICQSLNCEVFITVGNQEKREFIKKKFNIDDEHIGNSHDTTFEKQFMTLTKGKGIDVVLNSLAEDILQASVRCLALNGRFLEIGKYDMQMNKTLGLFAFLQNISFHGVAIDCFLRERPGSKNFQSFMKQITKLLYDGIKNNVVKPIERTVFDTNQSEQAFRYMVTGKHIGKVLIKIRDEESEKIVVTPKPLRVNAFVKTWFHPSKVYIIVGGLGGFGLELAYWMVMRGAKKLVLTSRTGFKNAYQKLYLKRFEDIEKLVEEYKIDMTVSTNNAVTLEGANKLIDEANKVGNVGGIFNLALVLKDGFIENQTVDTFKEVCEPKLNLLVNLDKVTQAKCPQLDYFVCFSSLTSGRGNAGQTNYGYANSAMERICELRRYKGLYGLAVQWFGPIGDVGVLAELLLANEDNGDKIMIAMKSYGILLQRISSCLDVLDRFLQSSSPVLSSLEKADLEAAESQSEDEVIAQLCSHLNIDSRNDDETLGDIGLDSMMSVEIQQRLERDYEIILTLPQIRKVTVGELKEFRDGNKEKLRQYAQDIKKAKNNLATIRFEVATEPTIHLNDARTGKPVFILPPLEGIFDNFKQLAANLNRPVIGLQWTRNLNDQNDFKKLCSHFKDILERLAPEGDYDLIVQSFGALIGFHLSRKHVPIKSMVMLDGMEMIKTAAKYDEDEKLSILFSYLRSYIPERICKQMQKEVMEIKGEEARVSKVVETMKEFGGRQLIGKDYDEIMRKSFARADMMIRYKRRNMKKLASSDYLTNKIIKRKLKQNKTDVTVIKLLNRPEDLEKIEKRILENFGFNKELFAGAFELHTIIGNETDFMTTHAPKIANIINNKQ